MTDAKPIKRELSGKPMELDINKVLKDKKKSEILEIYSKETGLPVNLLELVWRFCEKTPEKTLKAIKKGQLKDKHRKFKPNRPHVEDGMIFETVTIGEPKQVNRIEEIKEELFGDVIHNGSNSETEGEITKTITDGNIEEAESSKEGSDGW